MSQEAALRLFASLLEARTGQQLSPNRHWRLEATLKPLMRHRGIADFEELAGRLAGSADPALTEAVIDAMLNNETSFFRDPLAFQLLNQALVERLRAATGSGRRLRVWCAGCSTGQEAYSLAMLGAELAAALPGAGLDILGTDVSAGAVERARRGVYTQFEVQRGLPVRSLLRWFDQHRDEWHIKRELRRSVSFARGRIDAAQRGSGFDLILCRNVLLYFIPTQRRRLFDILADALAPEGMLMLGAGESILGLTDRFEPDDEYRGLYRLTASARERLRA